MEVRQSIHSAHAKTLDTQGLREEFLVEQVFVADEYTMVYSHIDRIIVGGIMPVAKTVSVGGEVGKQLGLKKGFSLASTRRNRRSSTTTARRHIPLTRPKK